MATMGLGASLALALVVGVQVDPPQERIYGTVTTAAGHVLEGYLRWDRNEASWADFLDGEKEIPWEHLREAEELDPETAARARRERSIEAFGLRITWDRDDDAITRSASSVRFGHLASLVVRDDRSARLELKSGHSTVLHGTSTDIGRSLRGLVVQEPGGRETELRWRDLDRVDFRPAPADAGLPARRRLHGTLTTRSGLQLTGLVAWDLDEVFESDVLDGESVLDREDYEIEFGEIAALEYESERSTRVVLREGGELVLRGTNDVDRDNRGIEISDLSFGRAIVPWEDFGSLVLHSDRKKLGEYDAFLGGGLLYGTVRRADGSEVTGRVRWDNDEEGGWEVLDGWSGDVDYDLEFGLVQMIEKTGGGTARVTMKDGRVYELEDTSDVGRRNRGIFVMPDGAPTVMVKWDDFERVVFVS